MFHSRPFCFDSYMFIWNNKIYIKYISKDINKGVKNEHEAVRHCEYEIMNLFIEPASNSYKRTSWSLQDIVSEIISKDQK